MSVVSSTVVSRRLPYQYHHHLPVAYIFSGFTSASFTFEVQAIEIETDILQTQSQIKYRSGQTTKLYPVNTLQFCVWFESPEVRPMLQDMVKVQARKLKAALPGGDQNSIIAELTSELQSESKEQTTAGERNVLHWLTQQHATTCVSWLKKQNLQKATASEKDTTAWATIRLGCISRLCNCQQETSSLPCPTHAAKSVTLSDFLWIISDVMFENLPQSVPHLAMAVVLKCSGNGGGDGDDDSNGNANSNGTSASAPASSDVPNFCHFLGHMKKMARKEQDWTGLDGIGGPGFEKFLEAAVVQQQ